MNLTEGFIKTQVFIDFGAEPWYGSDQIDLSYPCRFSTVDFQLIATEALEEIADSIRVAAGYKPIHPIDFYSLEECDQEGWYDFFIGLNGYDETKVDSSIDFVVVNSASPDNETVYRISLSPEERKAIFTSLDEQCRKYLGKSCDDLLAESRKQMEESVSPESEKTK